MLSLTFTADDRLVIAAALARLSKTDPASGSDFASLVTGLAHEWKMSQAASAKTEKDVKRQEGLVSEAEKSTMNA